MDTHIARRTPTYGRKSHSGGDVYKRPQQELPQSQECPLEAKLAPPGELPRIKKEQYATLEECFMKCKNPNHNDIILAAAQCGMSEEETVVWFQHRLALWRKQQGLPANSGHVTDNIT